MATTTSFQGITFGNQIDSDNIEKQINRIIAKNFSASKEYKESIRVEVRRLFNGLLGFKPVVLVQVLEQ
jgi:ribulose bisphosphate carboxylase small subunit